MKWFYQLTGILAPSFRECAALHINFELLTPIEFDWLMSSAIYQVLSDLSFTDKEGLHAYQTVKVNVNVSKSTTSHHYYTFHMKQIGRGSLKGFWMTDEVSYHSSL